MKRKVSNTYYDPTDRPGGPLVSYYAKKGGKLPMANFTDYSGSQMYGKGGFFEFNQKPIIDNTRVKSVIVQIGRAHV